MVILAQSMPDEILAASGPASVQPRRRLRPSVMLMSAGARFALVAGALVAIWTTIALALT